MANFGGILTGDRIKEEIKKGNIEIDPYDEKRVGTNSYNLRLADEIFTYDNAVLDIAKENHGTIKSIPKEGLLLIPGKLYLARTVEWTKTNKFAPMLEGRSSTGRVGVAPHIAAGFGDVGFAGYWTLEITCVQPTIIYPGIEIAQIYYFTLADSEEDQGAPKLYNGKYQNNNGIQKSKWYEEFQVDEDQS